MAISTVLFDLDGVIRHFDPDHLAAVEARFGLAPGSLWAAAFEPELAERLTTGRCTREAWKSEVGRRVGSPEAAGAWLGAKATTDDEMLALVDELRAIGMTVAILTNGTDTIPTELAEAGIDVRVDAVFNSAEIGYAKPDRRAFEHVCAALGVRPAEVFFTDDSPHKFDGAVEIGMRVHHFTGLPDLRAALADAGVTPPPV